MKALWSGFGAAVIVVALTVPADAVAAPTTFGRLVPTAALAKAVRMDPPAPPLSPMLREMLERVNAERAARLARGDGAVPASMLTLLGLG